MDTLKDDVDAIREWKKANPLRRYREDQLDISQGDMASVIGVSAGAVGLWENGNFHPTPDNVAKIRKALRGDGDRIADALVVWSKNKPGGKS